MPDFNSTVIFILFCAVIVGILAYQVHKSKMKQAKLASDRAVADAMWAADYHNPASANYDPARVATENAANPPPVDSTES